MPHGPRLTVAAAVAVLLLGSQVLAGVPARTAAAAPLASGDPSTPRQRPSQMVLDDQAHAGSDLTFTAGPPVDVPFRPRPTDSWSIGGAAPRALPLATGATGASTPAPRAAVASTSPGLDREVLGFLPYWGLGDPIDYTALSTIAYFGLDAGVDPVTKQLVFPMVNSGLSGWNSSALTTVIDTAHANGVRVVLTVKCFAWTSSGASTCTSWLASSNSQGVLNRQTLAAGIAAAVKGRGVDGVNFDFEPIPANQSANFVDLVRRTRAALGAGYEITVDSTGWIGPGSYQTTSGYDVAGLTAPGAADAMVIMGYDYSNAASSTAGSVDPLDAAGYDLTATVAAYLAVTTPDHVILALPWYGRAWSTTSSGPGASTVPASSANPSEPCSVAVDYSYVVETMMAIGTKTWDPGQQSPYLTYQQTATSCHTTTDTRELYYDDVQSLGLRYDLVNSADLRGTGMWDLSKVVGSSGLHPELYDLIKAKFAPGAAAAYTALGPTRLLDTRTGLGLGGKFSAGTARRLVIAGAVGSGVPAGATAVTVNLTVTNQSAAGYLALTRTPTTAPSTSTLNFPLGDNRANGATVPLAPDGSLSIVYVAPPGATTDVILDLTGYFR